MPARPDRVHLAAAVMMVSCRAALPVPPPTEVASTVAPPAPQDDASASVARVRALESACRARLDTETVRASLAAVDRMRLALGSVCDVESVGDDPLHWLFRCRADAFFPLGYYDFAAEARSACRDVPALRGVPLNRWACAGALLQDARSVLGGVEVAVVGHVDAVDLAQNRPFHPCPELRSDLGYSPVPPWPELAAGASPDARRAGNDQLAWCRAANVARHVRCGMALATRTGPWPPGDPCAAPGTPPRGAPVAVVGASTAWQDAQPATACSPAADPAQAYRGYCAEARRVDVFVKFIPAATARHAPCERTGTDAATALWCLQDCLERAAAPTHGDRAPEVPLLVPCTSPLAPLPTGWYRAPALDADGNCRDVNVDAIRHSLHISP